VCLKRILFFGALTLAASTVLILAALLWPHHFSFLYFEGPAHQSDAEMIANFQEHRTEFELLRKMMVEDRGLRLVDNNKTLPEDLNSIHIPLVRIRAYRRLLRDLTIRRGISATGDRRQILLKASSCGFVTHSSEKGYLYTDNPVEPKEIVNDLDHFKERTYNSGMRRIEGNWFLYYTGY
jgi:hypothetical protein